MVVSAASSIGAHAAGGGYADPTFPLVPLCCTLLASPHLADVHPRHSTSPHLAIPRRVATAHRQTHSCTASRLVSLHLISPWIASSRFDRLGPLFFCPATVNLVYSRAATRCPAISRAKFDDKFEMCNISSSQLRYYSHPCVISSDLYIFQKFSWRNKSFHFVSLFQSSL